MRRFELDSAAHLRSVTCPVLVLHSPEDEIVPYVLGQRLYQAAPMPKHFQALRGGHNTGFLLSQPQYEKAIGTFLAARL